MMFLDYMDTAVTRRIGLIVLIFSLTLGGFVSCSESDDPSPNNINKTVNQQPVGTSAQAFLQDTDFTKLIVEIQYVEEFAPTQEALDNLKQFLMSTLNKPDGITFKESSIPSPGLAPYSVADIRSIEDENRTDYNSDQNLAAYIFFADGEYNENTENSKILGIAYRNTSMAIFESTVHELSDEILEPDRAVLESTILNHEFGHVLGLVGIGSPTQTDHQDFEHGHHCDVEDCLMNWVVQTGDIVQNLANSNTVPPLDAQCLADLQANGGK